MIERDHIGKLGLTGLLLDPERPYLECVDEKEPGAGTDGWA